MPEVRTSYSATHQLGGVPMPESDKAKVIIRVTKKADKLVQNILKNVAEAKEVLEELKKLKEGKE